jgi:hypothetical protein
VEVHNDAGVVLLSVDNLLVISLGQQRQEQALNAE